MKTKTTIAFFLNCMFIFQTAFIGKKRMMVSVIVFNTPMEVKNTGRSIQVPGIARSCILGLGLHSNILAIVIAV